MRVNLAAMYVHPAAPVARVRTQVADAVPARAEAQRQVADAPSSSQRDLRAARAEALAELRNVPSTLVSPNRLNGLDRDQLSTMVYDRDGRYSLEERSGALARLEARDREFLDRARDLARISGDERVLHEAVIALEGSKSPVERAVPDGEAVPDVSALRRRSAALTAQLGGAPVSVSLRYPDDLSHASARPFNAASPGADRVAQIYRDSLF
jgi:hypothetical protein